MLQNRKHVIGVGHLVWNSALLMGHYVKSCIMLFGQETTESAGTK